ncbi:MAG: TetM/TetW/TetO/TetS family tetracycline resistance ribosomal protection protein [Chloroflexi bacterium]|nr:TetM/TetW/TetO/TetS family tetracycline resistance ribosomal protection protein [Chloroflexota bacterium]
MGTLNLGILAHVDAGKTTLTERLLYAAGAIDQIGSVDRGTTQTDSLALERERGITIKSAVASFTIGDLAVNLIDTPGHPDFIAEVERVLNVLDGAVLVISAVEGVQPQTPLLMRALQRLRVPTLIFVNKIDRPGASDRRVVDAMAKRLTPAIVPMGSAHGLGTRDAGFTPATADHAAFRAGLTELLAERDDAILAAYLEDDRAVPYRRLRRLLAEQTRQALVHPAFFGSAITGAGVDTLMAGIAELLPAAAGDREASASGRVFKIERTASGERVAYARLFLGTLQTRDHVRYGQGAEGRVTAISVFAPGGAVQRSSISAGDIAKVSGLGGVQIGDAIGDIPAAEAQHHFPPPTMESVVVPRHPAEKGRLRVALAKLAEQDPLINVRQDDASGALSLSLYGEVQKEVIQATLAGDYGIDVEFRETTMICIERPVGTAEALEVLHAMSKTNVTGKSSPHSTNPFPATAGLRIEPAPIGSGIGFRLDVDVRLVPLYIYKRVEAFIEHMGQYAREALQEGLCGWQVTDCTVTMTDCGYRAPETTASHFRKVTRLVLMQALERAGTQVCEPMAAVRLDVPTDAVSRVLPLLARLGARVQAPVPGGELSTIDAVLPVALVHDLQRQLPAVTGGEGVLEFEFGGYQPAAGAPPTRRRRTQNRLTRPMHSPPSGLPVPKGTATP